MKRHEISDLIAVSRRYGGDSRFVLLGGGNTSQKIGDVMYVKASGCALGTIAEDGFVAMSLPRLQEIWEKTYPANVDEREKLVLQDMMASRVDGETARPSVEALLHALIPFAYVVHLHPAMVNGLTCGQSGKASMEKLFSDALWIPLVNPGYILAKTVRDAQSRFVEQYGHTPQIVFLQNHGVFVSANSLEEIETLYAQIMEKLSHSIIRKPNFSEIKLDTDRIEFVQKAMRSYFGGKKDYPIVANHELSNRLVDKEAFSSISSAYTPDHIVYSGFMPLWINESIFTEADSVESMSSAIQNFVDSYGVPPKVIAVQNTAAFATSEAALSLFVDTIKVAVFTESFGGPRFMDNDQIEFIRTWEVEQYRSKMNA